MLKKTHTKKHLLKYFAGKPKTKLDFKAIRHSNIVIMLTN